MAQTSVAQFASELKVPPSVLLEQLRAAGVEKRIADDSLTEQDKARLLEYLRKSHGSVESKNKITLTRKQTSEIKKSDAMGKARTIQVEVRALPMESDFLISLVCLRVSVILFFGSAEPCDLRRYSSSRALSWSLRESSATRFSTPAARNCSSSTEGGTFSSLANWATLV